MVFNFLMKPKHLKKSKQYPNFIQHLTQLTSGMGSSIGGVPTAKNRHSFRNFPMFFQHIWLSLKSSSSFLLSSDPSLEKNTPNPIVFSHLSDWLPACHAVKQQTVHTFSTFIHNAQVHFIRQFTKHIQ